MPVGRLGREQVTTRSFASPFRRTSVSGDVTEALLNREFVDFGGAFVCGAGFIVATQLASVRLLVTLISALGGTLYVLLRDAPPGGKFRLPEQQLLGALGGFIAP